MKQIAKILIIILFSTIFVPSVFAFPIPQDSACLPGDIYNLDTGELCTGGGGEGICLNGATWSAVTGCTLVVGGGGGGNPPPAGVTKKASLFIATNEETNLTQTSAKLHGVGSYDTTSGQLPPIFPVTAYFRYSSKPISPIFCNDIYGTNMTSTKDIKLHLSSSIVSESFYQNISGLSPNTTYYYCAIISNKDNIAYGGTSVVREFHTDCINTTIETSPATGIQATSATLSGSYCSSKKGGGDVKTSFQYRGPLDGATTKPWVKITESVINHIMGTNTNVYGKFNFNLFGLSSSSKYEFQAIAENGSGANVKTLKGRTENLTTLAIVGGDNNGGSKNDGGGTDNNGGGTNNGGSNGGTTYGGSGSGGGTNGGGGTNTGGGTSGGTTYGGDSGSGGGTNSGGGTTYGGDSGSGGGTNSGGGTYGGSGSGGGINNGGGTYSGGTTYGGGGNNGGGNGNNGGTFGNGIINNTTNTPTLGQTATPPNMDVVRYHEGIETVFARQIVADTAFAKKYGYTESSNLQNFAWNLADQFARIFGYVNQAGKEIRVSAPDVAAYQLQLVGNKLTVYEYYYNKIVDIRNITTVFKNASGYEYYFKK